MTKAVFKKGMTVAEIKKAANSRWKELYVVKQYLNEKGKAAEETFYTIEFNCDWADTREELAQAILEDIKFRRIKDERVINNLNNFVKNFLQ